MAERLCCLPSKFPGQPSSLSLAKQGPHVSISMMQGKADLSSCACAWQA